MLHLFITYCYIGALIKNNHWIVVLLPFHAAVTFPKPNKTRSVDDGRTLYTTYRVVSDFSSMTEQVATTGPSKLHFSRDKLLATFFAWKPIRQTPAVHSRSTAIQHLSYPHAWHWQHKDLPPAAPSSKSI